MAKKPSTMAVFAAVVVLIVGACSSSATTRKLAIVLGLFTIASSSGVRSIYQYL